MKKKKVLRLIRGVLLLCIIVCLVQLCRTYYLSFRHRQKQAAMGERRWENMQGAADDAADGGTPRGEAAGEAADVPPQPRILAGLGGLYEENHDLVGWLSIEGMKIDYPVMQCGDNDYYLNHDFYGEEDKYGCLFVKDIADVNTPADNFVIYGHNMKDGSMFGDLDLYKKEAFYLGRSMFPIKRVFFIQI